MSFVLFLVTFFLLNLSCVWIAEVHSLAMPVQQQLGKMKRKLRGIANTLKQEVNDPLICIQCSKGSIEEITSSSFLSNLGK